MPTYVYRCPNCGKKFEVIKVLRHIDNPETCPRCETISKRIIEFEGKMIPEAFQSYFHYGLGKYVRSKRDIKNEIQRIAGEEGREVIEVGNEKIKPEREEVKVDKREMLRDFSKVRRGHSK